MGLVQLGMLAWVYFTLKRLFEAQEPVQVIRSTIGRVQVSPAGRILKSKVCRPVGFRGVRGIFEGDLRQIVERLLVCLLVFELSLSEGARPLFES